MKLQRPKDAVKGVVDTQYMDGRIERLVNDGSDRKYLLVEGRTETDRSCSRSHKKSC